MLKRLIVLGFVLFVVQQVFVGLSAANAVSKTMASHTVKLNQY